MSFTITATFKTLAELQLAAVALDRALAGALSPAERGETDARPDPRPAKPDAKAPAAAPKPPAPKPADKPAAVEYPVLQKAVFELAGKSKDKALELLAQFQVKSFKDLAAEKYGEALAAVQAAIAELNEPAVA